MVRNRLTLCRLTWKHQRLSNKKRGATLPETLRAVLTKSVVTSLLELPGLAPLQVWSRTIPTNSDIVDNRLDIFNKQQFSQSTFISKSGVIKLSLNSFFIESEFCAFIKVIWNDHFCFSYSLLIDNYLSKLFIITDMTTMRQVGT